MQKKWTVETCMEIFLNNKAFFILVLMMLIAQPLSGGIFFNYNNISSVSRQISPNLIIALGYTILLATGSMDLSAGNIVSMCGIVFGILTFKIPLPVAILLTVVCGGICGFLNGYVSMRFKLAPFIVTLAAGQIYDGFAYLLCDGKSIAGISNSVKFLGQGIIWGIIPISIVIALILSVFIAIMIGRTKYGRHILATGGNREAARVSGINTFFIKVSGFMALGLCSALASVILTGRVAIAMPSAGDTFTLDCIAAVAVGGTPMSGGKAKVSGTIIGCIIIGVISNILNLCGVSAFWQKVCKGLIIIIAVLLDSLSESFFKEQQRKASAI